MMPADELLVAASTTSGAITGSAMPPARAGPEMAANSTAEIARRFKAISFAMTPNHVKSRKRVGQSELRMGRQVCRHSLQIRHILRCNLARKACQASATGRTMAARKLP